MRLKLIDNDFPVWEVSEFHVPKYMFTGDDTYDQGYESDTVHLRKESKPGIDKLDFCDAWDANTTILEKYIQGDISNIEEVRQMWMKSLSKFRMPKFKDVGVVIQDGEGFDMSPHIDNRHVFGVLIINLEDNPEGSGTRFLELGYEGPVLKGTGVFMLNNWNTTHAITNPGPGPRLIGYQMLHIDSI